MPRRPRAVVKAARQPRARVRPAAIGRARDDAMAAIARHRGEDGVNTALLDTAQLLLTRHWAKAGWAARAKLIEDAGWLIRVSQNARMIENAG